jgi:adenine-specific DNA-methyltransferase
VASALTTGREVGGLSTVEEIVACCVNLGSCQVGGPLSLPEEQQIAWSAGVETAPGILDSVRKRIQNGEDPLGEALSGLRSPLARRLQGAIYTPFPIVRSMIAWTIAHTVSTVVDPGCGSGRFAAEAVRQRPELNICAVDLDPVATLITRCALACLEHKNSSVVNADFVTWNAPHPPGLVGIVGNPPYVRHHDIGPEGKELGRKAASRLGIPWSGLAGLHVLFTTAAALQMRDEDVLCFITSTEWLDVRYGVVLRAMLREQPRLQAISILDPRSSAFADVMTTASIFYAKQGAENTEVWGQVIADAADFAQFGDGSRLIRLDDLLPNGRWTSLVRGNEHERDTADLVPLGAIARVSRGVATGSNEFFILTKEDAEARGIEAFVRPALTSAEEILLSNGTFRVSSKTKYVLDIPLTLGGEALSHPTLGKYLAEGQRRGASERYLSRQRKYWWVLSPVVPPIVATYMARRPPAFALNPDGAAILNVCHGIYPRIELNSRQLCGLVRYLNGLGEKLDGAGRTYHGGLHKFEPREMEAILVPPVARLADYSAEEA